MRGLLEIIPIQDVFASGLGAIEKLEGGNLRFYLYASQVAEEGGAIERVIVAKIILHSSAVPDAIMQSIAVLNGAVASIAPMVIDMVH